MSRVLIVDDSKLMRSVIKAMLVEIGHEVIAEGANGLEGFDLYNMHKPDFVTLDITMPILSGIETLKKILEHDPQAKIIMVTSNAQKSKLMEALMSGAIDYLLKPLNINQLKETLDKHIKA